LNKRRKKKELQSKQKTTPESAEHTMGSPKRRKHKTEDLNPSPVAQSKLGKEMGKTAFLFMRKHVTMSFPSEIHFYLTHVTKIFFTRLG
jgi:hypothetical protein